jgi:hypothetical protein
VTEPDGAGPLPSALRLQVIQMEQTSLLWQRSLTWNEAFNRASTFVATVSGAIIAIALVAQAASFGRAFLVCALVLLGVTMLVGVATLVRLVEVNNEDLLWVQGLNRLRHAYLELADDLKPYVVSGRHDDDAGVLASLGASPDVRPIVHHLLVTTPAVVATIDAVLAGAMVALAALFAGASLIWPIGLGVGVFLVTLAGLGAYQMRSLRSSSWHATVRFPSPASTDPDAPGSP